MFFSAPLERIAKLDAGLNFEQDVIVPGIIDANEVLLFFKRNIVGKQALFDRQQSFTRGDGDHVVLQTGAVCGRGFCAERLPGIQTDVMVIATSADKECPWKMGSDIET